MYLRGRESTTPPLTSTPQQYQLGEKVEARFRAQKFGEKSTLWFHGQVTAVQPQIQRMEAHGSTISHTLTETTKRKCQKSMCACPRAHHPQG